VTESTAPGAASTDEADSQDLLVREGDIAGDYLERLLDIADVDGDIDMDVEGERAVVAIVGDGLDALVGQSGQVLEAVQELTRLAVVRETGVRSRLMLDIGGWRAARKTELTAIGARAASRSCGRPVCAPGSCSTSAGGAPPARPSSRPSAPALPSAARSRGSGSGSPP